jgi:hypothetical protein
MTTRNRNLLIGGVVAAAVLVAVVVVLVAGGGSSKHNASGADASTTSTTSEASSTSSTRPGKSTSTTSKGGGSGIPTTTAPSTPIPLDVTASSGLNMHDGQVMTVTVVAKPGSAFYGLDARLCAGTAAIENFYDFSPDPAGNCILHPLSKDSDAHLELPVAPPYKTGTLHFRVGVGTSQFKTENLTNASITCDPTHPCQLVVRLQYPNGFGFKAFRITYAG